jgi:hypothetical protein
MTTYDFILRFALPNPTVDPVHFVDALFVAGCDDAVVGVGMSGSIALDFSREAPTAEQAVNFAINAVTSAIPGARLAGISARSWTQILPR